MCALCACVCVHLQIHSDCMNSCALSNVWFLKALGISISTHHRTVVKKNGRLGTCTDWINGLSSSWNNTTIKKIRVPQRYLKVVPVLCLRRIWRLHPRLATWKWGPQFATSPIREAGWTKITGTLAFGSDAATDPSPEKKSENREIPRLFPWLSPSRTGSNIQGSTRPKASLAKNLCRSFILGDFTLSSGPKMLGDFHHRKQYWSSPD